MRVPFALLFAATLACGGDAGHPATGDTGDATTDTAGAEPDSTLDVPPDDATGDASDDPTDAGPDGSGDASADAGDADAGDPDPVRCSAPPAADPMVVAPFPVPASPKAGIGPFERASYERLRDYVLEDPGVFFFATLDRVTGRYVVESGPVSARVRFEFERTPAGSEDAFVVVEGTAESVFGCTDATAYLTSDGLFAAFENRGFTLEGLGYLDDDVRVGTLPSELQCYPAPLVRIAALFDAPDAPDAVATLHPWALAAPATHGGLGILQSRAALMLSGAGTLRGAVIEDAAWLPDVAPTVLAALGADTTGGIGPHGIVDDGLYLQRQDGRVLWEALAADPCDRARHAVVLLFDGLAANELNHQLLSDAPDVDIPTLRTMANEGVVYLGGAVANFPSVSAPGHMTAGSGVWSGHHGMIANAFYGRAETSMISPYGIVEDPSYFILHPEEIQALYDRATAPGFETLAEAVHRGIAPWDPATGEGAFAAVFNEVSIGGADRTTFDAIGGAKAGLDEYRLADQLAVAQVEGLLRTASLPVPTTLQVSFLATDAAGESAGPHSERLRAELRTADGHVARIRSAYAARGALERTLFVIVSDHGMELQDPTRASQFATRVSTSGVQLSFSSTGLVYFRTLAVETSEAGDGAVRVHVTNLDDDSPVEGAMVACTECAALPELTDGDGATVIVPTAPGTELTVTAAGFNPQSVTLP